ncbi:MAG: hypothetical protein HRU28_09430, partial [Rhizobiales bacterium]|nr:hypothetical protein [Hyphomicrobiales bacterium]
MNAEANPELFRIALKLDLELPFRCNMEGFAGGQEYAAESGWDCVINPFADRVIGSKRAGVTFDGVLAH